MKESIIYYRFPFRFSLLEISYSLLDLHADLATLSQSYWEIFQEPQLKMAEAILADYLEDLRQINDNQRLVAFEEGFWYLHDALQQLIQTYQPTVKGRLSAVTFTEPGTVTLTYASS